MSIPAPPDARRLLAAAGLSPKKSWGQNFLCDANILARIAAVACVDPSQPVVELGAGLGALTHHLLLQGGPVVAVERDRELVPVLRRSFEWAANLEVLEADAATLDLGELAQRWGGSLVVVGNLPYQLASRILVHVADASRSIQRSVMLVQREVAERVVAQPGGRIYGLLSVLVQRSFRAEIRFGVPPGAFFPKPRVHSALLALVPHGNRLPEREDRLLQTTARAAFQSRRKTLVNALCGGLGLDKAVVRQVLEAAGIAPASRAEQLSVHQFASLGLAFEHAGAIRLHG